MSRSETNRPVFVTILGFVALTTSIVGVSAQANESGEVAIEGGTEYRILATNRTSTMERELNEAAAEGFRLEAVMGGETAFGGSEVVAVVGRKAPGARFRYRLLATLKTSTMQKELQNAAADGYHYRSQTVFDTAFGGKEVVVILERDGDSSPPPSEYLLLATKRTSTLQKELQEAAYQGFQVVGLTVSETALGGTETVAITRRPSAQD